MGDTLQYACGLLARREHSVEELRGKLERKWPEADDIDGTIEQLLEEGLLSDQRFAAAFVRSRVAKFQGPRKIRAELAKRSVAESEIEAALAPPGDSWASLALQWLERKNPDLEDYKSRAAYYRRLANRGFTHDQAMDALKMLETPRKWV